MPRIRHAYRRSFSLRIEALEARRVLAGALASNLHFDVNQDSVVTSADANIILNALESNQEPLSHYDVNGDGIVSVRDVVNVANYLQLVGQSDRPESELVPSADVSLPTQARQREVVSLTVNSVADLDLLSLDRLELDWGDGTITSVPADAVSFPLLRLHRYVGASANQSVMTRAVMTDTQVFTLSSDPIDIVANSPSVVDRVDEGLTAEVFTNLGVDFDFTDAPAATRIDPTIDFDFGSNGPDPKLGSVQDPFAIQWSGTFRPNETGDHTFHVLTGGNDEIKVFIDAVPVIDTFGLPTDLESTAVVSLTEGVSVNLVIQYVAGSSDSSIEVGFQTDSAFKVALPSVQLSPSQSAADLRPGILVERFPILVTDGISELRATQEFVDNVPSEGFDETDFAYVDAAAIVQGTRARTLLTAPVTGNYTFHLAASDVAQLWLSQSHASDNSNLITSVQLPAGAADFADPNAGISAAISLVAGQIYYLESLHTHTDGLMAGHLAVGWTRPDQQASGPQLIPAVYLRPVVPVVAIQAEVSTTHESSLVALGSRFVIERSDDLGRDLDVTYTIGGDTDENDYASLSGIVTVPKGETAIAVDLSPIDDAILEGTELTRIRLVADPGYQMAPESQREVRLTIEGEVDSSTELLPQDYAAFIAGAYTNGEPANTFVSDRENDITLPFVTGTTGDNVLRVDVTSFVNPWDVLVGYSFDSATVPDGSQYLASVWARSANPGTDALLGMRIQEAGGTYQGKEDLWDLSDQWSLVVWPFTADFGGSSLDRTFDYRFGYQDQTVELGGFSLHRIDAPVDVETLPRSIFSYDGREANSDWKTGLEADIAAIRDYSAQFSIVDVLGNAVEGAQVSLAPLTPTLKIGTSTTPELIVPTTNPATQTPDALRYGSVLATYFDSLTDGGTAQWGPWLNDPTVPMEFANWVASHDIDYHGHAVLWGEISGFPAPDFLQTTYDQIVADQGLAAGEAWLEAELLAHASTGPTDVLSGVRNGSAEPVVTWWDVVNHPIHSDVIWEIVGEGFMLQVIDATRAAVHPDTPLIINEFSILSDPDGGISDEFFNLLSSLDLNAVSGQAGYEQIGFQTHFVSNRVPSIERIQTEIDRYTVFDRDIQITEFDVDTQWFDQQTQADFTRDFLQLARATDGLDAFTYWGFWENEHWRSSEGAALFNADWTPKPNGQVFLDHHDDAFRDMTFTTDSSGRLRASIAASEVLVRIEGYTDTFVVDLADLNGTQIQISTNQAPAITSDGADDTAAVSVDENQLLATTVTSTDPDLVDIVSYSISGGQDQTLFQIDVTSGELTFVTAPDFESDPGPFEVIVQATDLGNLSDTQVISVAINDVLDTPQKFVVNTIDDSSDTNPGDGVAIDANGMTSLRAAIEEANALANNVVGPDVISFDIPGVSHVISLSSQLPTITDSVFIDGSSEPEFTGTPIVQIDGSGSIADGLRVNATGVTILGLSLTGFTNDGMELTGGGSHLITENYIGIDPAGAIAENRFGLKVTSSTANLVDGNVISGNTGSGVYVVGPTATSNVFVNNYVGTDPTGQSAIANGGNGIFLLSPDNTVGGPGQGNLISGNAKAGLSLHATANNTIVQGNYIGTDSTGTVALPNQNYGTLVRSSGNTLGGSQLDGSGNLFSGNNRHGLILLDTADNNSIHGNYFGTDLTGNVAVPNTSYGIYVLGATNNTIGSSVVGEGNLVSGNDRSGIVLEVSASGNAIVGNKIGTTLDGNSALANNGSGVLLTTDANNNSVASNQIAGNTGIGVTIVGSSSSNNSIQDNSIGTDAAGTAILGNGPFGILISSPNNTVGGQAASEGNVVAGSDKAIVLDGIDSHDNVVANNWLGVDQSLTVNLGAETGVQFGGGAFDNTVGPGNVIANHQTGLRLTGTSGVGNKVTQNSFLANSVVGIDLGTPGPTGNDVDDLDEGPNRGINHPELTSAMLLGDDLEIQFSVPTPFTAATYPLEIEFFVSDGDAQGNTYLGSASYTQNDIGTTMTVTLVSVSGLIPTMSFLTATSTDASGNTSEFSAQIPVVSGGALRIGPSGSRSTMDVNSDGTISAADALAIINNLGDQTASGEDVVTGDWGPVDYTALDALKIINWLGAEPNTETNADTAIALLVDSGLEDLLKNDDEEFAGLLSVPRT